MNKTISIVEVSLNQKELLRNLLTEYLKELSFIIEDEIDTAYPYFDSYFEDKSRQAFFILNNKNIIGFVFINDYCLLKENQIAIAEFYILKEFRHKGFAQKAVKHIFKLSDKKWEVKTSLKNKVALSFWRKVIPNQKEILLEEKVVFYSSIYSINQ